MERLVCLAVGYLFGIFQTGYIYGRVHGIDIRKYGSGNSGSTNALRVMGKKAGLTVFAGDFLKTVIPCMAVRCIFKNQPDYAYVYMLYIGLGVILGHNYPFYLHFKGGKGIAATAGIIFSIDWRLTVLCLAVFILIVAVTRYDFPGLSGSFRDPSGMEYLHGKMRGIQFKRCIFYRVWCNDSGVRHLWLWRHRANILSLSMEMKTRSAQKKS